MDTLTEQHRQAQLALRRQTVAALLTIWPALDLARLDATYPAWATAAGLLINRNRLTSAGLAARYLRLFRAENIDLDGFLPVLAGPAEPEQLDTVLRTTSVVSVKKAMSRGDKLAAAAEKAFVLHAGASSRLVLEAGRQTVTDTIAADPRAVGYRRVLGGGGCDFCKMLVGRGAVYGRESSQFEAHDHCGCTAEPVYE